MTAARWRSLIRIAPLGLCLTLIAGAAAADDASALVGDLQAPGVAARRHAADAVRQADRATRLRALPTLIDRLMTEKDGQVRLAVLEAVAALGPDAEPAVPALLHTLRTSYGGLNLEEAHQDYRSALALAAIGRPAVAGLRGLLNERKENVRAEAIMALGRIGPDAAPAVGDLLPLLGDKADRIGREAALALGRIGEAAVELLLVAGATGDASSRGRALVALGELARPDDRVAAVVGAAAGDADPRVRAEAIRTLAHLHRPDAAMLPVLRDRIRDGDEAVRLATVDWLVGRRELLARLTPDLADLLVAADDGVARHAAFLLSQLGPAGAAPLVAALPSPASRVDAIGVALAAVGRPVVPILLRALQADDPRVRRGAALALGQIRPLDPAAVPTLVAGLDDPDPAVRADFLAAIGHLGPRGRDAIPAVRPLLGDRAAAIRLGAIAVLAQAAPRDDRLVADLTPLVADEVPSVQGRAIDVLRSLGPPGRPALPRVVGALRSPDAAVRLVAVGFVASHGPGGVEAVPTLATLLDDPAPPVRLAVAETLGKLGRAAQATYPGLAALVGDERVEIREAAALALGNLELGADVLRPDLVRALRDDKIEVRRAALKSIQRLGPGGSVFIPDLIPLMAVKENARAVDRLLRSFERAGPDVGSLADLARLAEHEQVAVRLQAIKFLGLAGPAAGAALPTLERIRDDPNAEVRQQVNTACAQIRGASPPTAAAGGGRN